MKNLVLLENLIEDTTIKDANILACDNMNDVIYIATNMTVTGYHTVDKQVSLLWTECCYCTSRF